MAVLAMAQAGDSTRLMPKSPARGQRMEGVAQATHSPTWPAFSTSVHLALSLLQPILVHHTRGIPPTLSSLAHRF